jgi:regulatory protein
VKIVDITKKGNKAIITKDDGTTLELDLKLTENTYDEISNLNEEEIYALNEKSEYYTTKNSAYRYLARRSHSVYELKQKLLKKDFNESVVDAIISELIEMGYLNDKKFAEEFVDARIKSKADGIQKIKSQLYKRGISKGFIDDAIKKVSHESEDVILDNVFKLARRKYDQIVSHKSLEIPKQKIREKLTLYLVNKGYSYSEIAKALNEIIK